MLTAFRGIAFRKFESNLSYGSSIQCIMFSLISIKTNSMQHILIVGATGVLGHATAMHFLHKRCKVTALVRDPVRAEDLKRDGAKIVVCDLSTLSCDPGIFNDVEVVLTAAHGMMGKGKNGSSAIDDKANKWLIDEAKKAGVKQFIFTSIHDVSADHPIDFFRTKYNVEEYLKSSGINYTILRLSAFMEWHAYNMLGKSIVEKGKTTLFGKGENKTNFIAVDDIVTALNQIAGNAYYFNKTIELSGPGNFTKKEVVQQFGKHLGISPRVTHVPETALKLMSVVFKPFHQGLSRVMKVSLYTEHSNQARQEGETIEQFGMQPTTLEQFVSSMVDKKNQK
jgi:uncharacterized protein YbjT (DUF2867 family)